MNLDRKTIEAARRLRKELEAQSRERERLAAPVGEFKNRYRSWCLAECKAECARSFSLVRKVQDTATNIFVDFIEPLTADKKIQTTIALCKRMHWPDSMSAPENELYDRFREHWSMESSHRGQVVSELRSTPHQLEIQERFLRHNPSKKAIALSLHKAIKKTAGTSFGRLLEDRPSVLIYEKTVSSWHVVTSFELLGPSQLRYAHHVHSSPGGKRETRIYSGISILQWMGIHPDSTWSWLIPADIPDAAESVRQICVHFLAHADELLQVPGAVI